MCIHQDLSFFEPPVRRLNALFILLDKAPLTMTELLNTPIAAHDVLATWLIARRGGVAGGVKRVLGSRVGAPWLLRRRLVAACPSPLGRLPSAG